VSTLDHATGMDAQDSLAAYRAEFHLPVAASGQSQTYLCGNSLGLQPRRARDYVLEELREWEKHAVEGHVNAVRPWLTYHERLTPGLALIAGALPSEVVAMNSLTVNLHLLLASFYRPTQQRYKILIERSAFPSDRYAAVSQIQWHGFDPHTTLMEVGPRDGEELVRTEDIEAVLQREGASIATVILPGVQYLTGQCFDMAEIVRLAHRQGCAVGFDLAHAIGNVPLALHDWNADFAVWCSYKYLNSGPGAIGGAFVHERHHATALPRLAGWWGHDKDSRFAMPEQFNPIRGVEAWQLSNPPILAAAPLLASLELFTRAGMPALREKSMRLTAYLEQLLRERASRQVTIITPHDSAARGAQLSLRLNVAREQAKHIHAQLAARDFICDWREPDVLRVTPTPFYNTYKEVWMLVDTLLGIMH
jgi:kynureninase